MDIRLLEAIYAALVGLLLAVAGTLMQGVTHNPLAELGIQGLLTGASFVVVIAVGYFNIANSSLIPLLAALGATGTAALVWGVAAAAPSGTSPLIFVLSGSAITAFLEAFLALVNLLDQQSFETLQVWLTGTLAGRSKDILAWTLPWTIGGLLISFAIARQVTALAMGDETAVKLGVDLARLKAPSMLAVIALTEASVAMAGLMAFVGLVIPHVARLFTGADNRWIIPYSAGIGAAYLLMADIAARLVLAP